MDEEILKVLEGRNRMMTAVIANHLRGEYPTKYNGKLETSRVRRCLERMEQDGKVKRVASPYLVQICWTKVEALKGRPLPDKEV